MAAGLCLTLVFTSKGFKSCLRLTLDKVLCSNVKPSLNDSNKVLTKDDCTLVRDRFSKVSKLFR